MNEKNVDKSPSSVALRDYIREVCIEVLSGVLEAQNDEELGEFIGVRPTKGEYKDESGRVISYVEFDVAAEVSISADGGGGINVLNVAKAQGKMERKRADSNRVSFSIPIVMPEPSQQVELREKIKKEREKQQAETIRKMGEYNREAYADQARWRSQRGF